MAGEWVAQLSDDLKANEAFTSYETLSDFAKAHLDTMGRASELDGKAKTLEGEIGDLQGRLANSIPKLGENATDEEREAFYKAFGRPEQATEYEFPTIEGQEPDQTLIDWAQKTFHVAGLNKEQGSLIAHAWNGFIQGLRQAEEDAIKEAQNKAKAEIMVQAGGSEEKYNEYIELSKRLWKDVTGSELDIFLNESGIGYDPRFIQVMLYFAKKTGEDTTLPAAHAAGGEIKEGIVYDKSPPPPKPQ